MMSVSCYPSDMLGRINLLVEIRSASGGAVSEHIPRVARNHINRPWIELTLFLINTDGSEAKVSNPTTPYLN